MREREIERDRERERERERERGKRVLFYLAYLLQCMHVQVNMYMYAYTQHV